MKHIASSIPLCWFALCLSIAEAEPLISSQEWRDACDGSEIEIVSEHKKVLGLRASAVHSAVIVEWSVHFVDGKPVSAEYREISRGRIADGEHAGEYSGEDKLSKTQTWKWSGDECPIKDEQLAKDFAEMLVIAKKHADQATVPKESPQKD